MDIDTEFLDSTKHIGIKIGDARRLMGLTQKDLADRLGITRQAISKLEQTESVDEDRLEKIATALGVSLEGLKKFNSENVLYYTNNFFENCGVTATNGGVVGAARIENINHFSIEQAMKLFEELLKMEREKFQAAKSEK